MEPFSFGWRMRDQAPARERRRLVVNVDLIEVDVIGLQVAQALFASRLDVDAARAAIVVAGADGQADLGVEVAVQEPTCRLLVAAPARHAEGHRSERKLGDEQERVADTSREGDLDTDQSRVVQDVLGVAHVDSIDELADASDYADTFSLELWEIVDSPASSNSWSITGRFSQGKESSPSKQTIIRFSPDGVMLGPRSRPYDGRLWAEITSG